VAARSVSLPDGVTAPAAGRRPATRRADPLALRAFDAPVALRRAFGRATLFAEGSAERAILRLLATDDPGERAQTAVLLSGWRWPSPAARRLFDEVLPLAGGRVLPSGPWGEDRAADHLMLRALPAPRPSDTPAYAAAVPWEGFLAWAGGLLFYRGEALPEDLLPAGAAALAAARGHRPALDALAERLPAGRLGARARDALRALSLRLALEGTLGPAAVRWLVPSPRGGGSRGPSPESWRPALLALHASRRSGNETALVHLTAALAAAHFRSALGRSAAAAGLDVAIPRWGAPPLSAAAQESLRGALDRLTGVSLWADPPWPGEWGGPDDVAIGTRLALLLGRSEAVGLVLLDDRLAVAAIWALLGRTQSALAQLAGWRTAPLFQAARDALRARIVPGFGPGLPGERPLGREAEAVLASLEATPDPSVALGSPHWLLARGRGALTSRLIRGGRRDLARHLRTVLDRPDQRERLAPFWILRGDEDTASVLGLASWLRERVPALGDRDWTRFLEWRCRQIAT